MCGRYSNHVKSMLDWSALLGDWPEDVPESHNIAPGQMIAGFTDSGGTALRWGLIPPWANDTSGRYSTFNARLESVASKPAYRHAWKRGNCCLIPALGYYEWRASETGKQPYFIRRQDDEPMLLAGLYEPARDDSVPASCTMLTRDARDDLAHIHPRMPVTLSLADGQDWLATAEPDAGVLMIQSETLKIVSFPVSKRVNNARNEGDDLIDSIQDP